MALTIRQRYSRARERLLKAQKELWQIQKDCEHRNLQQTFITSSRQSYHCPDCRRDWELLVL